jgi:hypothetical protein
MKYPVVVVGALLLLGCPPEPHVPDPTPVPEDTEHCGAAERRLEELDCKDREGNPMWVNKRGERFGETCRIAQEEARIFVNPKCIGAAKTCDEANACPPE